MTFDPGSVQAVVFDIGGVFTYPAYGPVEQQLQTMGLTPPDDVVEYRRAHHAGLRAMVREPSAGSPIERVGDDYLLAYDTAYIVSLGLSAELVDDIRPTIRTDWDWVYEANVKAFHHLAAAGMPTAVVSNNDGTAPQQMRDGGVCQVGPGPLPSVAAIVDSTLVGVAKPDPAIFTPALDALAVEPAAALYIGDTAHLDVVGALAAGMQVAQLDPFDHHIGFEHTRLPDLSALLDTLPGVGP